MTDFDTIRAMLDAARISYTMDQPDGEPWVPRTATRILRVQPGYQAHFEMAFNAEGALMDCGQYDEL